MSDQCAKNPRCTLMDDHGGSCDPRSEVERWNAYYKLLDANTPDDEIERKMDEGAREAFGRLPS